MVYTLPNHGVPCNILYQTMVYHVTLLGRGILIQSTKSCVHDLHTIINDEDTFLLDFPSNSEAFASELLEKS